MFQLVHSSTYVFNTEIVASFDSLNLQATYYGVIFTSMSIFIESAPLLHSDENPRRMCCWVWQPAFIRKIWQPALF